jgi:UDP-N-acetylglucosamine 2-epimerase (non-hydrolysing)
MIYLIGGARPNFMKIAAIERELILRDFEYEIIHTGQHYDYNMNEVFFKEFGLKEPYKHLEVGSGNHGEQTAKIMDRFEKVCLDERPDMVLVVGDVNSTMGCALVAAKLHIPIAHQEAGMRSFDKKMPEEINRIVTDHVSDLLFPISPQDRRNLLNEGIDSKKIHLVGDPMIDNLLFYTERTPIYDDDLFLLVEIHRPVNTDIKDNLEEIIIGLSKLSEKHHVVFTVHPRTSKMIDEFGLWKHTGMIDVLDPLGYFDFIKLMKNASCVITDSDGVQQETSILDVPCVAIRDTSNIEYTINYGTTRLCQPDSDKIFSSVINLLENPPKSNYPDQLRMLNDGQSARRMVGVINEYFSCWFPKERNDSSSTIATITPTS